MEAENIVDKKELKGLPIWACILLFIVVFFVFMLLYSALIQGFLSFPFFWLYNCLLFA